tara:strand:+ start:116 stop:319 length:204 start_codon:yes stop_codon:yes gene_type:complete
MDRDTRPKTKPVSTSTGSNGWKYALYGNGELWIMGKGGIRAGYLMNPCEEHIDIAIGNFEEELRSLR